MSTGLAVFTLFHVALSVAGIIRLGRGVRADFRLSADYRSDQRDRILVSVPQILAFAWRCNRFLARFGDVDSGSLRLHLAGAWRRVYVIGAVSALHLNVFVLIAQFFMKIPALKVLAPTPSEPPFLGTQIVVMLIFIVLGVLATRRFPGQPVHVF